MGNIGLGELLVIGLVVLLVFGPNRLPEIMRNMGKAMRAFQQESQRAASLLKEGLEEKAPPAAAAPPSNVPTTPTAPGIIDTPDEQPPGTARADAPANGSASPPPRAPLPPEVARLRPYEDT